ncbi:tetratricopeptide repeat protein [Sphingomonas sp.]|uniref:tetratricopeptide repeat protein n=1 Tax=Sphingomonas sp. TaxID=28214 RepID=UPI002DD653A0|nr:tetratricopeptide repeat protein [Sphingomonas sp.]
MSRVLRSAALAVALFAAVPSHAAQRTPDRVAALIAEAAALKAGGDAPGGLAKARVAVALAEKDPGRDDATLFAALEALTEHIPDVDFEQQFATYDRLGPVAARAKGPGSYPALSAMAGRNAIGFVLRKPGATLEAFADALTRATAVASTEREQAQMTGLAMVLAQFYDATGQHPKAVAIVDTVGRFYDTPPKVPNNSYAPGLMSLALRYSDWQMWDKAMDAADRAIAASVAFHGRRVVEITSALKVRGQALAMAGRDAEAEAAYREAVALADTAPDLGVTSSALFNLSRWYTSIGRDALAVPLLQRVVDMLENAGPVQSNTRMIALLDLYNIASRAGDRPEALRYARLARADADRRGFGASGNYVAILIAVANASSLAGAFDDAAEAVAAADALLPKVAAADSPRRADIRYARAVLERERGDPAAAAASIRSAIEIWEAASAADKRQIAVARAALARLLYASGDKAAAWRIGREGARSMSAVVVDRAARSGSQLLDPESARVFDGAVDLAWATTHASR